MLFDLNQYDNKGNGPSSPAGDNTILLSKNVDQRPIRYRHLVLADDWYKSGRSKRKHRKSNLPIGFKQLNDIISKRWESVDEETKEYLKKIVAAEWKVYKAEKKKFIKKTADKIKASHTNGLETNVLGNNQGGVICAGKMYDSSQKQGGPSMSMAWMCQTDTDPRRNKSNNYSSNITPPNASPNMSGQARRSPHLSLRDCRENKDATILIQNGNAFGSCTEDRFSSLMGPSSTAVHSETFLVTNNVKNGSYKNSSILDVGAKTATESWFDTTTTPKHDSFESCKGPPAIYLDSKDYLPTPTSKPTRLVQTPHFLQNNVTKLPDTFSSLPDPPKATFPSRYILIGNQHKSSHGLNDIRRGTKRGNRLSIIMNQNQNEGRQGGTNVISSCLQWPDPQNGGSQVKSFFKAHNSIPFASDCKTSFSDYNIHRGDTDRMMGSSTPAHCQIPDDSTCYRECPCNDADVMIPDSSSSACFHPVKVTSPATRTSFHGIASSRSIDFHGYLHHVDKANYNELKNYELSGFNDEDKFVGANSEFYVSQLSNTSFHTVDETSLAINGERPASPINYPSSQPSIARFHPVDETTIATCYNPSSGSIVFPFTKT